MPEEAIIKAAIGRSSVAWFRREDWDEIKRLCVDDLQDTFDEWLRAAEAGVAAHATQGFLIEKIVLTPQDIRERELTTGRKVDGPGRARIALEKMVKADKGRTRN